jgi:hypothetical protein
MALELAKVGVASNACAVATALRLVDTLLLLTFVFRAGYGRLREQGRHRRSQKGSTYQLESPLPRDGASAHALS